jgi:hypothetical protein
MHLLPQQVAIVVLKLYTNLTMDERDREINSLIKDFKSTILCVRETRITHSRGYPVDMTPGIHVLLHESEHHILMCSVFLQ